MDEGIILNQTTIENLKALGGDELLHELIDLFLEHSPGLLSNISNGQSTSDWDQVSRAAHSLKSSAGNIGAFQLQAVASNIEQAANKSDGPAINDSIIPLTPAYDAVSKALKQLR